MVKAKPIICHVTPMVMVCVAVFWTTTVLRSVAAMSDIVLVQRWNLWLGISDKAFFMLSNAVIYDIVYMLAFMPAVVLTSKLCPKGHPRPHPPSDRAACYREEALQAPCALVAPFPSRSPRTPFVSLRQHCPSL